MWRGRLEAVTLVMKILPYIVAIYFAVELFQVTGTLDWLLRPFQSILKATGPLRRSVLLLDYPPNERLRCHVPGPEVNGEIRA